MYIYIYVSLVSNYGVISYANISQSFLSHHHRQIFRGTDVDKCLPGKFHIKCK